MGLRSWKAFLADRTGMMEALKAATALGTLFNTSQLPRQRPIFHNCPISVENFFSIVACLLPHHYTIRKPYEFLFAPLFTSHLHLRCTYLGRHLQLDI